MYDRLVWLDNKILRASNAKISVLSPSCQFGINVFEGIRGYKQEQDMQVLNLVSYQDHIKRLGESVKLMGMNYSVDQELILEAISSVLHANGFSSDVALRVVIMESSRDGSWSTCGECSLLIAPVEKKRSSIRQINKLTCCTTSWSRINDNILPPRVKAGANYLNSRYALLDAKSKGFDQPIFLNSMGYVAESAGSCLVLIKQGRLVSPDQRSSILESITLGHIERLARLRGIDVDRRPVERTELYLADEVFLCGSAVEVSSVVKIDQYQINDGEPGAITKLLLSDYLQFVSSVSSADDTSLQEVSIKKIP